MNLQLAAFPKPMTTLFIYSPAEGHTFPHHPENPSRGLAIQTVFEREGLFADLLLLPPTAATDAQLLRTHHAHLVEVVHGVSRRGGGRLDADTYATAESYDLARIAVGSACSAVDYIVTGQADNGFVVARPPGHHAEYKSVGGFCLFNNVAAAARQAQRVHKLQRVMILDFDVHHGNGTQDIFYHDNTILFISLHQYGHYFYPGTGAANEIGRDKGAGFNLNVPLPPQVGNAGYDFIFRDLILPRARAFQPELILISAGYDAHWADPLASAALSLRGYTTLSQQLVEMADELCNGRILFVLEGGYLLDALAYGVLNSTYALLKRDTMKDPLGEFEESETDVQPLLATLHKGVRTSCK